MPQPVYLLALQHGSRPAAPPTLGNLIRDAGPFAWLAIVLASFLLTFGGLMLALRTPARAFVLLAVLGVGPALLGFAGLAFGRAETEAVIASGGGPEDPARRRAGEQQARLPLWIGAACSALVLALAGLGLALSLRSRRDRPAPEDEPAP